MISQPTRLFVSIYVNAGVFLVPTAARNELVSYAFAEQRVVSDRSRLIIVSIQYEERLDLLKKCTI